MKDRSEAYALLSEYTKSESLIKHALAVEACMRWYAKHFEQDELETEKWAVTGLLHDFDYEMHPHSNPPDGHPFKGNAILTELEYPEDVRTAIMGHATYTNTPRDTLMAKTLFAVDELTGMVTAAVLVRPDKSLSGLKTKSVRKRMKDKSFAAAVNREDIVQGAEELGIELNQHIENVIDGMRNIADDLGLA